jgi:hypothetical protein
MEKILLISFAAIVILVLAGTIIGTAQKNDEKDSILYKIRVDKATGITEKTFTVQYINQQDTAKSTGSNANIIIIGPTLNVYCMILTLQPMCYATTQPECWNTVGPVNCPPVEEPGNPGPVNQDTMGPINCPPVEDLN